MAAATDSTCVRSRVRQVAVTFFARVRWIDIPTHYIESGERKEKGVQNQRDWQNREVLRNALRKLTEPVEHDVSLLVQKTDFGANLRILG